MSFRVQNEDIIMKLYAIKLFIQIVFNLIFFFTKERKQKCKFERQKEKKLDRNVKM